MEALHRGPFFPSAARWGLLVMGEGLGVFFPVSSSLQAFPTLQPSRSTGPELLKGKDSDLLKLPRAPVWAAEGGILAALPQKLLLFQV